MNGSFRESDLVKSVIATISGIKHDRSTLPSTLQPEEEQQLQERLLSLLYQEKDAQKRSKIVEVLVELGDNRVWSFPDAQRWLQQHFKTYPIENLPYSPELLDMISKTLTGVTDAETKRSLVISLGHWSEELCWQIHSPERNRFYSWSKEWLRELTSEDIQEIMNDNSAKIDQKVEFILSLGRLPLHANMVKELLQIMRSKVAPSELRHAAFISLLHQNDLSEDVHEFLIKHLQNHPWNDIERFMTTYCPVHCFDCVANGIASLEHIPSGFEEIILRLVQKSSGITGDLLLNQLECLLATENANVDIIVSQLEAVMMDKQLPSRTRHRALLILGEYFPEMVDWKSVTEKILQENDPTMVSSLIRVLADNADVDRGFFNDFLQHDNFIVRYEAQNALSRKTMSSGA